jgi:hypothetical protein
MTEEDVSHVPSVGPSCGGDTRRRARKRTLTEKGQAYSPKPVTRRRKADSPVVKGGQVSVSRKRLVFKPWRE